MANKTPNKTTQTEASVADFISSVDDETKRQDSQTLIEMMRDIMGEEPKMWGASMVGFGSYHYKGKSGREGDWFPVGFSPRKAALTLYLNGGFEERAMLLEKLGKHSIGKGCLYVKKLADVDLGVLRQMIAWSKAWAEAQS
jgi:hypothetical protein